jgi:hypothetical protein
MKSPDRKPPKPYHPPRLRIYGDLATLTRAIGNKGMPDGGVMMLMAKS